MRIILVLLALLIAVPAPPALAVQPDEILADPVLEARARALSKELRCLVCRNESIDDSNAELARDLRLLVRERLVAGDSDTQVLSYLVERYGEFVLLKPQFSIANAALWLAGPAAFLFGLIVIAAYLRTRRPQTAHGAAANEAPLSDEERKRLEDILNGQD
jgi:cytochrome c-type biogenesis protein CcmH